MSNRLILCPGVLRLRRGWTTLDLPARDIEHVRSVRSFDERGLRLRIEVWMRDGQRFTLPMSDPRDFGLGYVRRLLDVNTRYFVEDSSGLEELCARYYDTLVS